MLNSGDLLEYVTIDGRRTTNDQRSRTNDQELATPIEHSAHRLPRLVIGRSSLVRLVRVLGKKVGYCWFLQLSHPARSTGTRKQSGRPIRAMLEGVKSPHTGWCGGACSYCGRRVSGGEAGQQAPIHQPGDSASHSVYGRSAINCPVRP